MNGNWEEELTKDYKYDYSGVDVRAAAINDNFAIVGVNSYAMLWQKNIDDTWGWVTLFGRPEPDAYLSLPTEDFDSYELGISSVDIENDIIVVGRAEVGPGGKVNNVSIFKRIGGSWGEKKQGEIYDVYLPRAVIKSSYENRSDRYGYDVAVSSGFIAVGAPYANSESGKVHIYVEQDENNWVQYSVINPPAGSPTQFGKSIDLHGNYLIVGAPGGYSESGGAAYIYKIVGGAWELKQELQRDFGAGDYGFGNDVSIYGDYAVVGCADYEIETQNGWEYLMPRQSPYLYYRTGEIWGIPYNTAANNSYLRLESDSSQADGYGAAVSIGEKFLLVGAPRRNIIESEVGEVHVYNLNSAQSSIPFLDYNQINHSPQNISYASDSFTEIELKWYDADGANDISFTEIIIGNSQELQNESIQLKYEHSSNTLFLRNDDNLDWTSGQVGSSVLLLNNKVSLDLANTNVISSGFSLELNLRLNVAESFKGIHSVFTHAVDSSGLDSEWQNMGLFTSVNSALYAVKYTSGSGGSLQGDLNQTVALGGSTTPVEAVPDNGDSFIGWSWTQNGIEQSSTNPELTIPNVTEHILNVKAKFRYQLTVICSGDGKGTISSDLGEIDTSYDGELITGSNSVPFPNGSTVILTAIPDPGYVFDGWSGAVTSIENSLTISVDESKAVTATFSKKAYTITLKMPISPTTLQAGTPAEWHEIFRFYDLESEQFISTLEKQFTMTHGDPLVIHYMDDGYSGWQFSSLEQTSGESSISFKMDRNEVLNDGTNDYKQLIVGNDIGVTGNATFVVHFTGVKSLDGINNSGSNRHYKLSIIHTRNPLTSSIDFWRAKILFSLSGDPDPDQSRGLIEFSNDSHFSGSDQGFRLIRDDGSMPEFESIHDSIILTNSQLTVDPATIQYSLPTNYLWEIDFEVSFKDAGLHTMIHAAVSDAFENARFGYPDDGLENPNDQKMSSWLGHFVAMVTASSGRGIIEFVGGTEFTDGAREVLLPGEDSSTFTTTSLPGFHFYGWQDYPENAVLSDNTISFTNINSSVSANAGYYTQYITISGTVTDGSSPLSNVTIGLSNSDGMYSTDENGNYSFSVLFGSSFIILFEKDGYESQDVQINNIGLDQIVNITLNSSSQGFHISGQVLSGTVPIERAIISFSHDSSSITTLSDGTFSKAVDIGMETIVSVSHPDYTFSPDSVGPVLVEDDVWLEFTADQSSNLVVTLQMTDDLTQFGITTDDKFQYYDETTSTWKALSKTTPVSFSVSSGSDLTVKYRDRFEPDWRYALVTEASNKLAVPTDATDTENKLVQDRSGYDDTNDEGTFVIQNITESLALTVELMGREDWVEVEDNGSSRTYQQTIYHTYGRADLPDYLKLVLNLSDTSSVQFESDQTVFFEFNETRSGVNTSEKWFRLQGEDGTYWTNWTEIDSDDVHATSRASITCDASNITYDTSTLPKRVLTVKINYLNGFEDEARIGRSYYVSKNYSLKNGSENEWGGPEMRDYLRWHDVTVNVSPTDSGTVDYDGSSIALPETIRVFEDQDSETFTAFNASGFAFDSWSVTGTATVNPDSTSDSIFLENVYSDLDLIASFSSSAISNQSEFWDSSASQVISGGSITSGSIVSGEDIIFTYSLPTGYSFAGSAAFDGSHSGISYDPANKTVTVHEVTSSGILRIHVINGISVTFQMTDDLTDFEITTDDKFHYYDESTSTWKPLVQGVPIAYLVSSGSDLTFKYRDQFDPDWRYALVTEASNKLADPSDPADTENKLMQDRPSYDVINDEGTFVIQNITESLALTVELMGREDWIEVEDGGSSRTYQQTVYHTFNRADVPDYLKMVLNLSDTSSVQLESDQTVFFEFHEDRAGVNVSEKRIRMQGEDGTYWTNWTEIDSEDIHATSRASITCDASNITYDTSALPKRVLTVKINYLNGFEDEARIGRSYYVSRNTNLKNGNENDWGGPEMRDYLRWHDVTVNVSPTDSGTVDYDGSSIALPETIRVFEDQDSETFTAFNASGFAFDSWSVTGTATLNPDSTSDSIFLENVYSDLDLVATFAVIQSTSSSIRDFTSQIQVFIDPEEVGLAGAQWQWQSVVPGAAPWSPLYEHESSQTMRGVNLFNVRFSDLPGWSAPGVISIYNTSNNQLHRLNWDGKPKGRGLKSMCSGVDVEYRNISNRSASYTRLLLSRGVPLDFDHDGLQDVGFYRPSDQTWYIKDLEPVVFGSESTIPAPGDYNGDGRTEIAYFDDVTAYWHIYDGESFQFGERGDIPVPGDYDGDGITDPAIYRSSESKVFARLSSAKGLVRTVFAAGVPFAGDLDRDGEDDLIYQTIEHGVTMTWSSNDHPIHKVDIQDDFQNITPAYADYSGDGQMEIVVFDVNTATWISLDNKWKVQFGLPGDVPLPCDYDGDGKAELAVYRPSTGEWFIHGQAEAVYKGKSGDIPLASGN